MVEDAEELVEKVEETREKIERVKEERDKLLLLNRKLVEALENVERDIRIESGLERVRSGLDDAEEEDALNRIDVDRLEGLVSEAERIVQSID